MVECLPTLCSREECDDLAVNFCYINSKGARKRMVPLCVLLLKHSSSPNHAASLPPPL